MGREIKRVALDFDYPINGMIWKGYANPYQGLECSACDGSGESPELKDLSDNWHAFKDKSRQWKHSITQDEVQALIDNGRLSELTNGGTHIPTAREVNKWSSLSVMGHDAINKWICVKTRANRLGITEIECKYCKGEGVLWPDPKYAKLAEDFECIEPPAGEGYQLWSTTTEGTPMSPVFNSPEKLASWLYRNNASSFGSNTATFEQWMKFINGS